MDPRDDELQQRVCRACNDKYDYPVPHSSATRFHCPACAALPEPVRAVVERLNRRLRELERKLAAKAAPKPNAG